MKATPQILAERRTVRTTALSEVNQGISEVARDSIDREQEWEFFCECGREECHKYVSLTLDAYCALHDHGQLVLAEGHRLSQIERARGLLADAQAVRAQASHQVKRAIENLRISRDLHTGF